MLKFRLTRSDASSNHNSSKNNSLGHLAMSRANSNIICDLASSKQQQQQEQQNKFLMSAETMSGLKLPILKLAENQQPSASFSSSILVTAGHRRHNSRSLYTLARNLRRRIHSMFILRRSGFYILVFNW